MNFQKNYFGYEEENPNLSDARPILFITRKYVPPFLLCLRELPDHPKQQF